MDNDAAILIKAGEVQTLRFYNVRAGGLTVIKKDEKTGERIPGVQFEIRKMDGEIVGTFTTDENGVIYLPEAENGWYTVTEQKAADGYRLDDTPHRIEVRDGQTATLEITNKAISGILIHKVNAVTGEGIPPAFPSFSMTAATIPSRRKPAMTAVMSVLKT